MDWKKSQKQDTNALTVKTYCKSVLKENSDIMSHCSPVSDSNGRIMALKVIVKYNTDHKAEIKFKAQADIREDLEELTLINYKIQELCMNMRESTENS